MIILPGIYATVFRIFAPRQTALLLLWAAGAVGFVLGQTFAERFLALTSVRLGDAHVVESSLLAWLLMLVANRIRL